MTAGTAHMSEASGSEREMLDDDLSILLEAFRAPFLHLHGGQRFKRAEGRRELASIGPYGFDPDTARRPVPAEAGRRGDHQPEMN